MPRILFDSEHCAGHALCHATAPEVYQLDDNGYCLPPPNRIDESMRDAAMEGAESCPERVLQVVDDDEVSD